MLWLTQIGAHTSFAAHVLPAEILISLGMGLAFVPMSSTALFGVPAHDAGVASAPSTPPSRSVAPLAPHCSTRCSPRPRPPTWPPVSALRPCGRRLRSTATPSASPSVLPSCSWPPCPRLFDQCVESGYGGHRRARRSRTGVRPGLHRWPISEQAGASSVCVRESPGDPSVANALGAFLARATTAS